VTAAGLARVEAAESVLRGLGFVEFRVRHHGDLARVELIGPDLQRLLDPALRSTVAARLRALGYRFVSVDLEEFKSGRGSTLGG
jgi:pyridinium-3,5-biscarboxylic acid mononucleotide sulfurtransferase